MVALVKTPHAELLDVDALNTRFAHASAQQIVAFALEHYGARLVLASSFSVEDCALIDLAARIDADVRVITLDTGRLHQETYETLERVRRRYDVDVEVYFPRTDSVETLVRLKGPSSFYGSVEDRKECCFLRKVEPLRRALATSDAWATGLRREQSVTRTQLSPFELDDNNGPGRPLVKINPLHAWSHDDVWTYVEQNRVPYNPLHDRGFPSIGCAPCTRAVEPGEDQRAGRWWWESPEYKECGLHGRGGAK
jgi:phosphoadenosine phosphosulfate reductase